MTDRVHRDLSDNDIAQIADTYHVWKNTAVRAVHELPLRQYEDIPGFCKSVTTEEIRAQGYVLTPGRYVGAAELAEDDEPFEQKMARLTKELEAQFEESGKLETAIQKSLRNLFI